MIIDIHGHYTTAPEPLGAWRQQQLAALDGGQPPIPEGLVITDDQIRESIEPHQLRLMNERGIDVQVFSPRASFMAHHAGDFETSAAWSRHCNDLIGRVSQLYPDRFVPSAMLPQSPGVDASTVVDELERCVDEHDIVAVNLNPDPSGGNWTSPPLTDEYWFPVYEKLIEHDLPVMVHVSTSVNPVFHTTGAHYLNADTTAVMQLLEGDLFSTFPELNMIIPHGGGAAPYHWGRFRGLAMMMDKPPIEEHLLNNIFFDTCVYHQPGIDTLLEVIPHKNIMFASEMIGAVRTDDPNTGHSFDDTARYLKAAELTEESRRTIFEDTARRTHPRLDRRLTAQGR